MVGFQQGQEECEVLRRTPITVKGQNHLSSFLQHGRSNDAFKGGAGSRDGYGFEGPGLHGVKIGIPMHNIVQQQEMDYSHEVPKEPKSNSRSLVPTLPS